ncbi:MAG TPA: hypothetical protein PLB04_05010 [Nitrospira sp.]|nr:hypothetical protein [Nitrospira sp.]
MSTVLWEIPITLNKRRYLCDLRVAVYATNRAPAILLLDASTSASPEGEVIAVASTNVDASWLTGMPEGCVVAKDYSENTGLWKQLAELSGTDGAPLFTNTGKKVMLSPFVTASIYRLEGEALLAYNQLRGEMNAH